VEKDEGKYFYGVVASSEEKRFGNIGMNGNEVYTLPYRGIAAVVSDSPLIDFELTEDNTKRHEDVVREVMREHSVIPTEFGTTIKNKIVLKRLLKKAYHPTRESLKLVDNMVELGVKAVLNEKGALDTQKRKECASDVSESLRTVSNQAVAGELFSDRLVLNASFLVKKECVDAFSDEVARLQEKYPSLKFLYSGPWAPHNFVYIKIGAEGVEIKKVGET
jgi:hypothetical protein